MAVRWIASKLRLRFASARVVRIRLPVRCVPVMEIDACGTQPAWPANVANAGHNGFWSGVYCFHGDGLAGRRIAAAAWRGLLRGFHARTVWVYSADQAV
jgi:hypothetical protein